MSDKNIIKYGLKNLHMSKVTDTGSALTYDTPVRYRGAAELTVENNGDSAEVLGDDTTIAIIDIKKGKTGKLTMSYLPPEIEELLYNRIANEDGVITETTNDKVNSVAMMYEFSGDQNRVRHVLLNVKLSEPADGSKTRDKAENEPFEFDYTASADPYTDEVKHKVAEGGKAYNGWFDKVYAPVTSV